MTNKRKSIARILHDTEVAIENTFNIAVIQDQVALFGYGPERMQAGRLLHQAAVSAVKFRKREFGEQQKASNRCGDRRKEAVAAYQDLAKIARAIFVKTPARLVNLGLNKKMPKATAEFIHAAFQLFDGAPLNPELGDYGYTRERLASERMKIAGYQKAEAEHESAKGSTQHATEVQEKALQALIEWHAQYLKIARVALRNDHQLLENLGVKVRS